MVQRRVAIVIAIIGTLAGLAYYYIGVDGNFLAGLWRSREPANTNVTVVSPTNTTPSNSNSTASRKFTGFSQEVIVSGLEKPTRITFEPGSNQLLISQLDGKIIRAQSFDTPQGAGGKQTVASGFSQLLGVWSEADIGAAKLYTASRGTVSVLTRNDDGTYGARRDLVTNLPAGRHQTDLALIGPDGKMYIATGSRSDRGETAVDPKEAAILVADQDGSNLRVFASGLRNPFGMTFHDGKLYVSDNGQDVPSSGVPEELNLVEDGRDYGWPGCYGVNRGTDCSGTVAPLALLQEHSSANGFAFYEAEQFPADYRGNAFIALYGSNSRDPLIGKRVVRMIPADNGLWSTEDFVTGLGNPIDVKVSPADGSLLILDFGRGQVIRVKANYEGT